MKRKITALFIVICLLFCTSGCSLLGLGNTEANSNGKNNEENNLFNCGLTPIFSYSMDIENEKIDSESIKFGYLNDNFEIAIAPQFAYAGDFSSNGLARVGVYTDEYNGIYGYIDTSGTYVISPQFYPAGDFADNGLAFAVNAYDNKCGYIDKTGSFVIPPQFDSAASFTSNGLALVDIDDKCGYINNKGETVIAPQFDYAYSFSNDGLARVRNGDKWGYINTKGAFVVEPQFEDVGEFTENGLACAMQNGKWGYIDNKGDFVISPQFHFAGDFADNGLACVITDEGLGYIDINGVFVINPQFFPDTPVAYWYPSYDGMLNERQASKFANNGLALVGNEDIPGFGYIDEKGSFVISPQYALASDFYDDGYAVTSLVVYYDDTELFDYDSISIVDDTGTVMFCEKGVAPAFFTRYPLLSY